MNGKTETLQEKIYECDRHVDKILKSKMRISEKMPLSESCYSELDEIDESFIDQMIFRFSKLQDSMGEKIFPALLKLTGEEPKRKTFIDILNRLEELEILQKNQWMNLREIRNNIAHEYSTNKAEVAASISNVFFSCDLLISVYNSVKNFLRLRSWIE